MTGAVVVGKVGVEEEVVEEEEMVLAVLVEEDEVGPAVEIQVRRNVLGRTKTRLAGQIITGSGAMIRRWLEVGGHRHRLAYQHMIAEMTSGET